MVNKHFGDVKIRAFAIKLTPPNKPVENGLEVMFPGVVIILLGVPFALAGINLIKKGMNAIRPAMKTDMFAMILSGIRSW